jgi:arylsulfatase A-like enzyme
LPSRREFLKSVGAYAGARMAGSAAPARKPNIIFVLAGGWRGLSLDDLRLPNLEALAKEGVQFERLYTCYPLAAPSRAALITGRFPHACGVPRDGVRLPLDQPSIAEQLKRAGYRTGYIGEWRLDGVDDPGFVPPGPRRHRFDYWAAFNRGHRYFDSIYFRDAAEPIHRTGFEPDYQTDLAIDFIKQAGAKPSYLFLAWGPPHAPLTPLPDRVATIYDPPMLRLRANVPREQQASTQDSYASYYALCSALDDNIGRLVGALDQQHLAGDTIVVFTSDSGDMMGSQGLEDDDQPFEEAVRVPLIVRYPGAIAAGRKNDALLSNVDLMPTLLGLCGVAIPDSAQGQDLSVWLTRQQGSHGESIYCSGKLGDSNEWRMVVRGLDKLVVDRGLNVTHLYNLGQDPFEMENLVRDVSQDLKRDELKALLKDWMRRSGDGMDPSGLKRRV